MNPQTEDVSKRIPGAAPGLEHDEITALPSGAEEVFITCIDYSPDDLLVEEVADLKGFLEKHRPAWSMVRWINIDSLANMEVIHALATKYELHPLAVEDLLHRPQRPKMDTYGGSDSDIRARLFVIVRMLQMKEEELENEQISIFLGHKTILTFQENRGDVWDPIRQRISTKGSRIRNNDASFLMYSLLDSIIDQFFPLLESFGDRLEEMEDLVLERPQRTVFHEIHKVNRDLLQLRRAAWPTREVIYALQREPHECMGDMTRVYLRDIYDHIVQIIDMIETYRELAADLRDSYMSSVSMRMNEIMKVLTIISTIFIPLTFLAGVYGMNFRHLPELEYNWAYPAFWIVCVVLAGIMLLLFRRRGWLG